MKNPAVRWNVDPTELKRISETFLTGKDVPINPHLASLEGFSNLSFASAEIIRQLGYDI